MKKPVSLGSVRKHPTTYLTKESMSIEGAFKAYQERRMSEAQETAYLADIESGAFQLPEGETLERAPVAGLGAAKAYKEGRMSDVQKFDFERDIASGIIALPSEAAPLSVKDDIADFIDGEMSTERRAAFVEGVEAGSIQVPPWLKVTDNEEMSFLEGIGEVITGEQRRVPETEALPDWSEMPELRQPSFAGIKSAVGAVLSDPEELVQIIKSNYPETESTQDAKGNYILRSAIDGIDYAIKPGFRESDVPRTAATMAAFTPAGRAATIPGMIVGAMGTQAAIEGIQAGAGGDFDLVDIGMAGAGAGAMGAAGKGVGKIVSKFKKPIPVPTPAESLAKSAKKAAEGGLGSSKALKVLAEQASPDPKTIAAAERLGIVEYLQPDHVTTNQVYREIAQAVKSIPGSEARAAEMSGLRQVAKRADDLIDELGGTSDLSKLDSKVKDHLGALQSELEETAEVLYKRINDILPPKTQSPAPNLVGWLEGQVQDLGGVRNLSPLERNVLFKLRPKPITNGAGEVIGYKHPTYALLDRVRRDLTASRVRKQGIYKDADTGLIKKLEKELMKDQQSTVAKFELTDTFNEARQSVALRKGVENDIKALFGKNIQGSLIGDLSGSVKKLSAGDTSKFTQMIKAIPEAMRKEVTASGLATAFGITAKRGQLSFTSYSKWYEGLLKNKKAHAALMSNLPSGSRKRLSDLYRVSKGVSNATKEYITTGRSTAIQNQIQGADSIMANIYHTAKKATGRAVLAEAITTPLGVPGAGISAALASALTKGRTDTLKAADKLISSYAFNKAVREFGKKGEKKAINQLAKSPYFNNFAKKYGLGMSLSKKEQWILRSFQTTRQLKEE